MKPRVLTTLLICSSVLTTTVTPAIMGVTNAQAARQHVLKNKNKRQAAPKAADENVADLAMFDLGIKDGKVVDSKNNSKWSSLKAPTVTTDDETSGDVLNFDGHTAAYYAMTDQQRDQLKNGLTIEAYFKYDADFDTNSEHEIFSAQEGGGFGLGVQNGKLTFYAHDGSGYKTPQADLKAGHWVHAVGVIDKNNTASLYVNGKLASQVKMPGNLQFAFNTDNLVLGGDAKPFTQVQSLMKGKIKSARLFGQTLNADQVASLSKTAAAGTHEIARANQTVESGLVGPKKVAVGHTYGLNVHAHQLKAGENDTTTMDVVFDPGYFYYLDADRKLGGDKTKVEQVADGRLRITTTAKLTKDDFRQYAKTRLAHINLKAKKTAGKTEIRFEQVTKGDTVKLGKAVPVEVQGKYANDLNGDGIIGVGDVALASADKKAEVAKQAEIKPYKHVIVLTTDGGGNSWDPNGMYYAQGTDTPVWTTNPEILKKRKNTYTMDLFNKKFAMSTSAQSVAPAISAQNYISMLHGRPWETLPAEYQGTNGTMGQEYFADFGKERQLFPSIFKLLQKNNPTQGAAAFSEWGPIVNAIIEPDAAVKTKQSASLKSFDDVANYIETSDFDSTSMVYMQSDYMDGQGHSRGWYNDNYWNQYQQYDGLFKKVMDSLEKTGHIHDTLVIANADHGGAHTNHGPNDAPDRDIFMALGGETVDSGRRLHGGSNSDITAIVLDALQMPRAPHMFNSNVFDKSAFLKQTELGKKDRDVEKLHLARSGKQATISLSNLRDKRPVRAVDMVVDLGGQTIESVKAVKGVKILRQTVENGKLKLTISVDKASLNKLATIKFAKKGAAEKIALSQAMAATATGTEILVDLINEGKSQTEATATNKPSTTKPGENKPGETKPTTDASNTNNATNNTNHQSSSKPGHHKPSHQQHGHRLINWLKHFFR